MPARFRGVFFFLIRGERRKEEEDVKKKAENSVFFLHLLLSSKLKTQRVSQVSQSTSRSELVRVCRAESLAPKRKSTSLAPLASRTLAPLASRTLKTSERRAREAKTTKHNKLTGTHRERGCGDLLRTVVLIYTHLSEEQGGREKKEDSLSWDKIPTGQVFFFFSFFFPFYLPFTEI